MLDYISRSVASDTIKDLINQNKNNMKLIHDEYLANVVKKRVEEQKLEKRANAPQEVQVSNVKQKVNILIADDIKLNASILEAILKDVSHNICIASDGDIALEKLEKLHAMNETVDILFLDHHMPNMLGSQVVDTINSNVEKYTHSKIHIVSITNDPSAVEERKHLYDFHIRKPFIKNEIGQVIEEIKQLTYQKDKAS